MGWGGGHQLLVVKESFTEDAMLRVALQSPHGKNISGTEKSRYPARPRTAGF